MVERRVVQPWTHCRPPACLSWNCRAQDFGAHVVQHTASHRHCKRHVSFFNRVSADAVEQHVSLHLVWCVISWPRNWCKIPVSVMATTVTCRNASKSSCLTPPMILSDTASPKIVVHITVRVCKYRISTETHECSTLIPGRCERCARSVRKAHWCGAAEQHAKVSSQDSSVPSRATDPMVMYLPRLVVLQYQHILWPAVVTLLLKQNRGQMSA